MSLKYGLAERVGLKLREAPRCTVQFGDGKEPALNVSAHIEHGLIQVHLRFTSKGIKRQLKPILIKPNLHE